MSGYEFIVIEGLGEVICGEYTIVAESDYVVTILDVYHNGAIEDTIYFYKKKMDIVSVCLCSIHREHANKLGAILANRCSHTYMGRYIFEAPIQLNWVMTDIEKFFESL